MVEWTDAHIDILIEERRNRNIEYHNLGRNRNGFWHSIADKINQEHNTNFTGYHCKEKFSNLVRSYNAMCDYMAGNRRARRSRTGAQYFDEFRTHFWERPEDEFDRIRTINTSNRRRNRDVGNITPAPSVEEVSSMLNRRRRDSPTSQRDRSASPTRRTPSRRDETTNRDNANNTNNASGNSSNNTNNVGGNLNNATYSSSSELANMISKLNTSTSRSDSNLSMPDVGDSQLYKEPINEEGG